MAGWTPLPSSDPAHEDSLGDLGSPGLSYDDYRDTIPLTENDQFSRRRSSQLSPTNEDGLERLKDRSYTSASARSRKSHYSTYSDLDNHQHVYDYRRTRNQIFFKGFGELLLTLALCASIIGALFLYQGRDARDPKLLAKSDTRIFNALMIGLSLALGFNLASSLKSYANILRWSLLTRQWFSLEVFDLILGCAGQTKLMELVFVSWPWPRVGMMGKYPSKRIWAMGLCWLTVNLSAQIAVAALSLFWPAEPSKDGILLQRGNVSVANFDRWVAGYRQNEPYIDFAEQGAAANDWGRQAQDYKEMPYTGFENETDSSETVYYKRDGSERFWEYRFDDRSVNNMHRWTNRYIRASATCQEYEVLEQTSNCTWTDSDDYTHENVDCFWYTRYEGQPNWSYKLPPYSWMAGATTYMSEYPDGPTPCGDRCAHIAIYQPKGGEIIRNAFVECNATLSEIKDHDSTDNDFTNLPSDVREKIYMNKTTAAFGAGAIGLIGSSPWGAYWDAVQYNPVQRWSPNVTITAPMMENFVTRFAIGAVAAFNDHGPRLIVPDQLNAPMQAQTLQVDWLWIYVLVGGICGIQSVSLVLLMIFANKAIILDESSWSLARLLMPVVKKLGSEGSTMSGKDIVNAKVFEGEKIAYGVKTTAHGNRVDILWKGADRLKRTSFQAGVYE
ncbi:hypothetical protein EJ05DRAFT_508933 [Pseudovirgaria hyperparasitica]|uniref:Uncharacterized protein n=1 Tax=Pseudovirgaria hyperparasitica TaxID=470096 RepID=A0A6A6WC27_9PEZI|nr:uncharacterized protein EJ05DRAFT_508933 [Pseudovirgaria hyperparasitica]KAF2760392.1 hypothetical protein EJ05DRAFT_508933 [Pseudovirgaria hyperparasitica]